VTTPNAVRKNRVRVDMFREGFNVMPISIAKATM